MHYLLRTIRKRSFIKSFLIVLIIMYPLTGAFFGLDLGDTGYHLYAYENLISHPEQINYTTYLSSLAGYLWGFVAGGLGLLGYNLLEVLLEWGITALVYFTLRRYVGEITVLAGSLFSVMAADTYLNVFNYHQLNAALLTLILCLEFTAIMSERSIYSLLAGIAYTLVVFSRVGSVVAVVTLFLYLFDYMAFGASMDTTLRHLFRFLRGALYSLAAMALLMYATGTLGLFLTNITRLAGIASDDSSSYGFGNLLMSLIMNNIRALTAGLAFFGAAGVLFFAVNMILREYGTSKEKGIWVFAGLLAGSIALYIIRFSYHLTPAEKWPQMTSAPRFLIGVMYVTVFLCLVTHAFRGGRHARAITILCIASVMLILLTIAGSNTGTKHVVLAMWLIAPLCFYTGYFLITSRVLRRLITMSQSVCGLAMHPMTFRIVTGLLIFGFFLKYAHLIWYTTNYDSRFRSELTSTVNNNKVKGILTTRMEADAINGVLEAVDEYSESEGQPLMVFGNSLLFYYMTGRVAYSVPWVTQQSYPVEKYREDMDRAQEKYGDTLPVIVYCRINYAWGFHGYDYGPALKEILADDFGGKKLSFMNFLVRNMYGVCYINDFYAVMIPNFTMDRTAVMNIVYGYRKDDIEELFY